MNKREKEVGLEASVQYAYPQHSFHVKVGGPMEQGSVLLLRTFSSGMEGLIRCMALDPGGRKLSVFVGFIQLLHLLCQPSC